MLWNLEISIPITTLRMHMKRISTRDTRTATDVLCTEITTSVQSCGNLVSRFVFFSFPPSAYLSSYRCSFAFISSPMLFLDGVGKAVRYHPYFKLHPWSRVSRKTPLYTHVKTSLSGFSVVGERDEIERWNEMRIDQLRRKKRKERKGEREKNSRDCRGKPK